MRRNGLRFSAILVGVLAIVAAPLAALGQSDNQPAASAPYDPSLGFGPLGAGQARIFFYREGHFVGGMAIARVRLDGVTSAWVQNRQAVYVDHPAGEVKVSIDSPMDLGSADFTIPLEQGQEYFVPLAAQGNPMFTGGAAGYLLGSLKADVHQYCGGGWCAALVERNIALPTLQNLPISPPNPETKPLLGFFPQ